VQPLDIKSQLLQVCCNQGNDMAASCHSSTFVASFAVIEMLTSGFTVEAEAIDLSAKQLVMQPIALRISLVYLL